MTGIEWMLFLCLAVFVGLLVVASIGFFYEIGKNRGEEFERGNENMIELGREVKHKVTGFKGTATARSVYLSGCTHILITPPVKKNGEFREGQWFDEPEIEYVGRKKVMSAQPPSGGPRLSGPPSRSHSR